MKAASVRKVSELACRATGNSERPQHSGYQSRGGYGTATVVAVSRPQQGGYNNGGSYGRPQQGGYNSNRGGYNNNDGGWLRSSSAGWLRSRQQGGYESRPQQGGYGRHNSGGYGRPQGGGYGDNQWWWLWSSSAGWLWQQPWRLWPSTGWWLWQQPWWGGFRQRTPGYDPNAKYSLKKRIEYKEENFDPTEPLRLNKFLANAGVCSRREADEFIQAGLVTVNGEVVTELGTKILRTDEVKFHDAPVSLEKKVYVLLNKPKDYVTTSDDPQQRKTVMDLVKDVCPERIYPVGRLDRNTTGVLLLTNDGDLASKLTHPKFLKKKVYHVHLDKNADSSRYGSDS